MLDDIFGDKIKALEQIEAVLSSLEISSTHYDNSDSYNNFEKAYFVLLKNVHNYIEKCSVQKTIEDINLKFEKLENVKKKDPVKICQDGFQ